MRLQGDRVHTPESLTAWKRPRRCRRHIGKLSPAAVRNTRITGPLCYRECCIICNVCSVRGWLWDHNQHLHITTTDPASITVDYFIFIMLCLSCFPTFEGHTTTSKPSIVCALRSQMLGSNRHRDYLGGGRERRELANIWGKQKLQMLKLWSISGRKCLPRKAWWQDPKTSFS